MSEKNMWHRKHLLGIAELSADEIRFVLDTADRFEDIVTRAVKKTPALQGRTVVNMFYEPSTRTNLSFTTAERRLSADILSFSKSGSSAAKGETLVDTARNIEAMGVDIMVLRHQAAGAAKLLADNVRCSVVNAGDGEHEHPTQALLDLYTLRRWLHANRPDFPQEFSDLTVGIVGDIAHSRVARSNIWGLTKLGARVIVVGPATMMPVGIERLGVTVSSDLDDAIKKCDVLNMLRIQLERQNGFCPFPSLREYSRLFGVTRERLARLGKADLPIMHPGPVNRGIELSPELADSAQSLILKQVEYGVAVRMAVLFLVAGAGTNN
ncbi:aspartate carbamoyltransferase [Planctomycetales bacterium]|nr:aspartate carbamoyltransferase [Planctomycetales bacterium]